MLRSYPVLDCVASGPRAHPGKKGDPGCSAIAWRRDAVVSHYPAWLNSAFSPFAL